MPRKIFSFALILWCFTLGSQAYSQDETALFTSIAPDTLIVLDLSGSMLWTPAGQVMYTNSSNDCDSTSAAFFSEYGATHTKACDVDPYGTVPKYAAISSCSDSDPLFTGFYRSSDTGHTVDCSRLAIAKRAIFDVLDDNDSNTINNQDESSLGIRFGYMRFYNCAGDDSAGSYSSGCNSLVRVIGATYGNIWSSVDGESATGGTPLASSLYEAKLYLDAHKAADSAASCRQKFAILITDSADTFACSGNGSESQTDQYKRRRETVAKAKALADAGFRTFVVGFGASMPHFLKNTLNWAAFYGGTDNPIVANSGSTGAYVPSGISCEDSTTASHNIGGDGDHYYATLNDPGELDLTGYAFLAANANDLTTSLKQAIEMVREATYSFSLSSVSSQRTHDENNIYEASFQPVNLDPFWLGHLKKYTLNSDGSVGSMVWDAGSVLQSLAASSRNIVTYKGGATTAFTTAYITAEDLGASTTDANAQRDAIVGYIRGESAYNPDYWKLGDIFRSNPVTIGTPSSFFMDNRDTSNAFESFRTSNQRTTDNRIRVIVAGANDGQIHAFKTYDGSEVWSFIPPNFLTKLKNIAHTTDPTGLSHQYFVDGPVSAADIWLGTGDGTAKSASDWKTLLIFGEGRGSGNTLWSYSPDCNADLARPSLGFNSVYTTSNPYYCGYYGFDFTSPLSPVYRWRINPNSTQAPYLGEPWSKVAMGRVKINGNEKWVGFMGAGYNASDCAGGGGCDTRGKGFYVVDLSNGNVLWSYTRADNSLMNYSIPASPAIVDTDNDGFIDTVYAGDLGGNMWRFKFCTSSDLPTCNASNWAGGLLFGSSTGVIRPIFTTPSIAKDRNSNLWVEWGTGDKMDPTAADAQEKFYAVKDNDRTTAYGISDLENITSGTYTDDASKHGWYINLAGSGEKILADSTIFGGVVYFTSYFPPSGGNPCNQAGTGSLYGVNFTTGAGVITERDAGGTLTGSLVRSMTIGTGIPTAPVISFKPSGTYAAGASIADLYVTVSGGAGMTAATRRVNFDPPTLSNRTNLLYWKDRRVE